jgi:ribosomal-protein-alanine N-acetyltransferase
MQPLTITIKRATIKDLETLYKIEKECFIKEAFTKKQIKNLLQNSNVISLSAQTNGETAGFIIGLTYPNNKARIGHVITIDVAIKYRRKRIGMRLLNELERKFVRQSVETCYLEVRIDNVAARELYLKQGYKETNQLKHYYPKRTNGVRLKKKLLEPKSF